MRVERDSAAKGNTFRADALLSVDNESDLGVVVSW